MPVTIHIQADTAREARDEMANLLNGEPVPLRDRGAAEAKVEVTSGEPEAKPAPAPAPAPQKAETPADPIADLLNDSVRAIKQQLPDMSPSELIRLRDAERSGKARVTLLEAIEEAIKIANEAENESAEPPAADSDDATDTAQAEETKPAGDEFPTFDDAKAWATKVLNDETLGAPKLRELIDEHGAVKVIDLDGEQRASFIKDCKALLAD